MLWRTIAGLSTSQQKSAFLAKQISFLVPLARKLYLLAIIMIEVPSVSYAFPFNVSHIVVGTQRGRGTSLRRGSGRRRGLGRRAHLSRQEEVHALPHGIPHRHPQRGRTPRDAASLLHAYHMQ